MSQTTSEFGDFYEDIDCPRWADLGKEKESSFEDHVDERWFEMSHSKHEPSPFGNKSLKRKSMEDDGMATVEESPGCKMLYSPSLMQPIPRKIFNNFERTPSKKMKISPDTTNKNNNTNFFSTNVHLTSTEIVQTPIDEQRDEDLQNLRASCIGNVPHNSNPHSNTTKTMRSTPTRVFNNLDTNTMSSPMQESPSLMFQMENVENNSNGSKGKRNSRKWKLPTSKTKNNNINANMEQENQMPPPNRQLFNFSTTKLSTPELFQQQTPSISLSLMTFGGAKLF